MGNIYEQIVDDLKAERNAWCKESWHYYDEKKKTISTCLAGAVERATGVAYIKPGGKPFVTKDARKVIRAVNIVNHLADLIAGKGEVLYDYVPREVNMPLSSADGGLANIGGSQRADGAIDELILFNDADNTKKADIIRLLKRASAAYPND